MFHKTAHKEAYSANQAGGVKALLRKWVLILNFLSYSQNGSRVKPGMTGSLGVAGDFVFFLMKELFSFPGKFDAFGLGIIVN